MAKADADFDSVLLDYKAKGTTIELVGTEPINGKPAYHLKITKKSGLVQHYYLDVDTGLEVRTASDVDAGRRTRRTMTTDLSNYRTVDGLIDAVHDEAVDERDAGRGGDDLRSGKSTCRSTTTLFRMPAKQ